MPFCKEFFIPAGSTLCIHICMKSKRNSEFPEYLNPFMQLAVPQAQGIVVISLDVTCDDFRTWVKDEVLQIEQKGGILCLESVDLQASWDGKVWTARVGGPGGMENLLRVALALEAPRFNYLVVHAAGVAASGKGWLFPGPSGAGKSTIARILQNAGYEVLGDDLVLAGISTHGKVKIDRIPFVNLKPSSMCSLECIMFLKKSVRPYCKPLHPSASTMRLMSSLPFVTYSKKSLEQALLLAHRISDTVECCELGFDLEGKFIKII